MNTFELLGELDAEISRLQRVRDLLAGEASSGIQLTVLGSRKKRILSAEGREKIVAAQRKRWARQKTAAK